MKLNVTKVEIDPNYTEVLFLNFRLDGENDYYMQVLQTEGEYEPIRIYHDYERNENENNCPFCNTVLRNGGECVDLTDEVYSVYKVLLNHPKFKLRALCKGLK